MKSLPLNGSIGRTGNVLTTSGHKCRCGGDPLGIE